MPDAGAPDSAVDAAIPPDTFEQPFTLSYGGNPITQWTFEDAPIGTTGGVTLTVTNTASHPTAALSAQVTGADAAQFAIDPGSTCLGATLAPGAQCQLIVTFAPTGTAGARSASLAVTGGSAPFALALAGTAHTPQLHIHFAGTYHGRVVVEDNATYPYCDADCTVEEPVGTQLFLQASTAAVFAGWSGDCTGTDCSLTMTGDKTVTATFNLEDRAIGMFRRPHDILGLAFAADGSVLVGDANGVAAVALDGSELWTTAIAGGAHGLATDAAGNIYGVGGPSTARMIFKLSPTGDVVWTLANPAVATPTDISLSSNPTVQVSPDGSVIAAISATALYAYNADRTLRYSITGLAGVEGVAVAPSGEVTITSDDGEPDEQTVHRYDTTGAELSPLALLYGRQVSLACDGAGRVGALGTSFSKAKTFLFDAGVQQWGQFVTTDVSSAYNGLAFDAGGNTVAAFEVNVTFSGMRIEQRSPLAGALLWSLDRAGGLDLVFPIGVAADHAKRVAVARNDWYVTIYQMP